MASPAEIAQLLPDTLPADFSEWDSEDSQPARPMHASALESTHGIGVVPRQSVQKSAPPVAPEAAAVAALQEMRGGGSSKPATIYVDDDGFFRQLKNVNALMDKLPNVHAPMDEVAEEVKETRSSALLEAELMRAAGRPYSGLFESESVEVEEPKPKAESKLRNLFLVGAGTAVVFFGFHMIQARMMTRHAVAPHPAAAVTQPAASAPKAAPANAAPQSAQPAPASTPQAPTIRLSTLDTPQASNSRPVPVASKATPPPVQSQMMHDQLTAPTLIPQNIKKEGVAEPPLASDFNAAGVEGEGSNASIGNVFNGHSRPTVTTVPLKPVSISAGVAVGLLIKKTEPTYPPIAKSARVAGTVVVQATISKSGAVTNLHVVSGPAMLRQSALEAVRTWRYRPYKLNNDPVDVDTTVNVIFSLGS